MRDPKHMLLLYGDRAGFQPGWGLAIWAGGLLFLAAGSAVLSVVSFVGAQTPDATEVQLTEWGVIEPGEGWLAAVSDDDEGRSGCVLTRRAVVRWIDEKPVERLHLDAQLAVALGDDTLTLSSDRQNVTCPLKDEAFGLTFHDMVLERSKRQRARWHPGPDPRVAHLIQEGDGN